MITSEEEQQCIANSICNEKVEGTTPNIAWVGGEKVGAEYKWMVNETAEYDKPFIDSTRNAVLGMYAPNITAWSGYQKVYQETANSPSDFYAVTVCHEETAEDQSNWNITRKTEKHFVLFEYELPIECVHTGTVFEILGPPVEYWTAEAQASGYVWYGEEFEIEKKRRKKDKCRKLATRKKRNRCYKRIFRERLERQRMQTPTMSPTASPTTARPSAAGWLGTIMSSEEQKCVERLGFCGVERIWAAGEDNAANQRPHEWLWKSQFGPYQDIDSLFFVLDRPVDERLGLYANWDLAYQEPDNLLGEQHHLAVCTEHNKTWADESRHSRYRFLTEYNQSEPLNAPRVLAMEGIDGGVYVLFSEPLHDGGSPIIACQVSIHPIEL